MGSLKGLVVRDSDLASVIDNCLFLEFKKFKSGSITRI
jgi:hypothetical protein